VGWCGGQPILSSSSSTAERRTRTRGTLSHSPWAGRRRGILHNARQREDGSWAWRYRRPEPAGGAIPQFAPLWDVVSSLQVPLMLVRGMRPQSVVDDEAEAELLRRAPAARVAHVEGAGHSIQGDAPLELARLIGQFIS
jgi:pimeloyl-ACP methyl ester carboxylesterase